MVALTRMSIFAYFIIKAFQMKYAESFFQKRRPQQYKNFSRGCGKLSPYWNSNHPK